VVCIYLKMLVIGVADVKTKELGRDEEGSDGLTRLM
jgi:hypothetical protein